jgi:UDP-N-acetylmuramate dehydrogenase
MRKNVSLKDKNTFKIGGKAKYFSQPENLDELQHLMVVARKRRIPIRLLGAGSNVLIDDSGVSALVTKLDAPSFKEISVKGDCIYAGSGASLGELVKFAAKRGLSGLEFLAGIPGTLGGALVMNAGAWGQNIAKSVEEVVVLDYNGDVRLLKKKDLRFAYRKSNLDKFIILSAFLKVTKKNKSTINKSIKKYLENRRKSQDNSSPNAGCIFKNPSKDAAGRLIDLCNLKGKRIGGAVISEKHANFILNKGGAKASDVLRLIALARKEVKRKFNVILEPELKIWK